MNPHDIWKVVEHVMDSMDESTMREELAGYLYKYYEGNPDDMNELLPDAEKHIANIIFNDRHRFSLTDLEDIIEEAR